MINDITRQFIDAFIVHLQRDENKQKLHHFLVDPTIKYILDKLFPYLIGCAVIFILIILLTLIMIALVVYDLRIRKVA